jgi:hypothetical protein
MKMWLTLAPLSSQGFKSQSGVHALPKKRTVYHPNEVLKLARIAARMAAQDLRDNIEDCLNLTASTMTLNYTVWTRASYVACFEWEAG